MELLQVKYDFGDGPLLGSGASLFEHRLVHEGQAVVDFLERFQLLDAER
jgi:hypothetical protein